MDQKYGGKEGPDISSEKRGLGGKDQQGHQVTLEFRYYVMPQAQTHEGPTGWLWDQTFRLLETVMPPVTRSAGMGDGANQTQSHIQ